MKCNYPGCKKESKYQGHLNLINEEDSSVNLGFCKYHYFIIIGGHFKAKITRTPEQKCSDRIIPAKTDFKLIGPFKEIEIIQQVIAAREMVAALTEKEKMENLKVTKNL